MGQVIGAKEYRQWQGKKPLTLKDAVLADCYQCNGFETSLEDCQGEGSCPLYAYSPHGRKKGLHLA